MFDFDVVSGARRSHVVDFGLKSGHVWQVGSVLLSELWKRLAPRRNPAATHIKAEGKVYLSDKTYD